MKKLLLIIAILISLLSTFVSGSEADEDLDWNLSFNGGKYNSNDIPYGIAVDSSNNIYVVGHGDNVTGAGGRKNWWIKKFNSNAVEDTTNWNLSFVHNISTYPDSYLREVIVDNDGNIYVGGYGFDMISGSSYNDWWIKKFDSNGVELDFGGSSMQTCGSLPLGSNCTTNNKDLVFDGSGSSSGDIIKNMAVDSNNNLYVVGMGYHIVNGSVMGSSGDWWIKKFNSSGIEQDFGGSGLQACGNLPVGSSCSTNNKDLVFDSGSVSYASHSDSADFIRIDDNDNIYVFGVADNAVFASSYDDLWIKKFNTAGVEQDFGGSGLSACGSGSAGDSCSTNNKDLIFDADGGTEKAGGLDIDSNNFVYMVGSGQNLVSGSTSYDFWIKKFNTAGVEQDFGGNGISACGGGTSPCTTSNNDVAYDEGSAANYGGPLTIDLNDSIYVQGVTLDKYNSTGTEDTDWRIADINNIDMVTDGNGQVYVAGRGTNIVTGSSNADWWIRKFDSGIPVVPLYSNFAPDSETTNFSAAADLTDVANVTLATGDGKIKFPDIYSINVDNEDYDTHVIIQTGFISVNSSALDSSFNASAKLTLYGVNCSAPTVYFSDTSNSKYDVLAQGNVCNAPRCTDIQCSNNTLTVNVTSFSAYAMNGSSSLEIDADDPKNVGELVTFTANYSNETGGFIDSANCTIFFNDSSIEMDEQADIYNYSRTFSSVQTVNYNVTCSKIGYNPVTVSDTAQIQTGAVPEFSTITLGIGLICVLAGLIIVRRKTNTN